MVTTLTLEVLFTSAEFAALRERDLSQTVCVVFDVLRATTSMLTALAHGAEAIIPVAEIPEALALRQQRPDLSLTGERDGVRIRAHLTGSVDFDLGNSPREFTPDTVRSKTLVMTTTNGTRALRACAGARTVLVSCFLNLQATANWLKAQPPSNLLVVCSGTLEQAALEDALAAGALCEQVWPLFAGGQIADSAEMARQLYAAAQSDLLGAMPHARNARRLLANPDLRDDVPFCLQRDTLPFVAGLLADGTVRKLP